jgi:dihydrodipicolinate synthase/N-acetylneuraminate lyase
VHSFLAIFQESLVMANRLSGIFAPNVVPLNDSGEINEGELRRYVDWLIASGIDGLYPNGSTGEFVRFTAEERRFIVQIVCEQSRGRVPVLAGAAEANVRETIRACESYLDFGARAVAIISPYFYRMSPGNVCAYFQEIARNSPIDITLYNIPKFASPIDVPTVQKLADFPRVIGIKDSSGDMAQMLRMMAAIENQRPDFVFLCGWEPILVPMLTMGCHGGTLALSGVVPEVTRRLYELTTTGRLSEARSLQMRLTELFDRIIFDADFPEGVRSAVGLRGFEIGPSRQPMDGCSQIDRAALMQTMSRLISESTCPAGN